MKTLLYIIFIIYLNPLSAADKKGICIQWFEGDGLSLGKCKASSLSECSKGKKAVSLKQTSFQSYTGKLFKSKGDDGTLYEFQEKPASSCKPLIVSSARDYEGTMSANWGYAVYSDKLKKGDTAYIDGKNVTVREEGNLKAKKILSLNKGTKVEIIGKSAERADIPNFSYRAYWFQIAVQGQKGWVHGIYIHPDPNSEKSVISEGDDQ